MAHWEGSSAVRRRLEAIGRSSSSLVLFLEHIPWTLGAWLREARDGKGTELDMDDSYVWAEDALLRGTEFMGARGLVHFDTHFANVLTDGRQVYFADFGLALSRGFDLAPQETAFLADHLLYDRAYAPCHLLRHHLPEVVRGGAELGPFLREWTAGRRPTGVPPGIGAIIERHAAMAAVLDEFHRQLVKESKRTPFPAAEIRRTLADGQSSAGCGRA